MKKCIKNGLLIDPKTGLEKIRDLWIANGLIADITDSRVTELHEASEDMLVIDAAGKWVVPGLVDMHVHFRDPGYEYKEDIESGCRAAAAGGFTTVCCMPNTKPAIDSAAVLDYISERASMANGVKVLPSAALTIDRAGLKPVHMEKLAESGAYGFTDDGTGVADIKVMEECMEQAAGLNMPVFSHPEVKEVSAGGCMHLGEISERAGVAGIPPEAEELMIARDILLAKKTGCRLHIQHISTAMGVELVRAAKAQGIPVTAETAPHYFTLTDRDVAGDRGTAAGADGELKLSTNRKMNPPLRTKEDRDAIKAGLLDGTIDVIATDHAPHSDEEKQLPFPDAPFGVVGLETSFAVSYTMLVRQGEMPPRRLIRRMSTKPAEILGINAGSLEVGQPADIAIIDVDRKFTVNSGEFQSKSKNTPFEGMELYGVIDYTIIDGNIVYQREDRFKGQHPQQ